MVFDREQYFNVISKKLIFWSFYLQNRSKLNLLDDNVFSEDFCCELLNMIFSWKLVNGNALQQNQSGFDLIDKENKILVQVTSTRTKKKINYTLSKVDIPQYNDYILYMMFIDNSLQTSQLKKEQIKTSYIKFNVSENILDVNTLLRMIKSLPKTNLIEIYEYVRNEIVNDDIDREITSDLTKVVLSLAGKNFKQYANKRLPLPFSILDKIEYNKLDVYKDLILENNIYYPIMQEIYDIFDNEACNTGEAVWEKIAQFSRDIQIKEGLSGDSLFTRIWESCCEYAKSDPKLSVLSIEKIENCVRIIIVDAFLRCKIMKAPREDDENVIAYRYKANV